MNGHSLLHYTMPHLSVRCVNPRDNTYEAHQMAAISDWRHDLFKSKRATAVKIRAEKGP